jgi:hypothetical protein
MLKMTVIVTFCKHVSLIVMFTKMTLKNGLSFFLIVKTLTLNTLKTLKKIG